MNSLMPASVWCLFVLGLLTASILFGVVPLSPEVAAIIGLCFLCESIDSSLGMGFGTILVPVLLFAGYEPHQLVPAVLGSEALSGFASFFFHARAGNLSMKRSSIHRRAALSLVAFSVLGVALGVQVAVAISKKALMATMGAVIGIAGVTILLVGARPIRFRLWKVGVLGLIASFNKAVSGGGYGPLMTSGQILSGVEGKATVGITSLAEAFTCVGGVLLFLAHGRHFDMALFVPVAVGSLLSVPLSARVIRCLPERLVRRVIALATLGMAVLILARSLTA